MPGYSLTYALLLVVLKEQPFEKREVIIVIIICMVGRHFVDSVLKTPVDSSPWDHQIVKNTFPPVFFSKLSQQCRPLLNLDTHGKLQIILPEQFKDYGITIYDDVRDISQHILDNAKALTKKIYYKPRWYPNKTVYAYISITPPLPYQFEIHEEKLSKFWSSVTYISPENNIGTKMYTAKDPDTFVKESSWKPNKTFVFCGKKGITWHSYESGDQTNRITLNFFLMDATKGRYFI